MYYVLLLAFVVGACASTPKPVPDYLGALSNFKKASKLLVERLPHGGLILPEARSYAVLKNVISGLADLEYFLHVKYDDVYIAGTLISEAVGQVAPGLVVQLAKNRNDLALSRTAWIRQVIEEKCLPDLKIQEAECNEEVQAEVDSVHGLLDDQAAIILALGDLGYAYLKQDPELNEVAQKHGEVQYLLEGRDKLRNIVEKTLAAYKVLYAPTKPKAGG